MATFAQSRSKRSTPDNGKPLKLSVGHDQVVDSVSIDYGALLNRQWVMTVLNGDRFGFQIHEHPLNLAEPCGLIVYFVDDLGKFIATEPAIPAEPGDSSEPSADDSNADAPEMSIMEGEDVTNTIKQYIGEGTITLSEDKTPPLVRIIHAPINPDMLG